MHSLMSILLVLFILAVYVFIIQYCWNKTIADITQTQQLTFFQTFLLVVLIGTLLHTPIMLSI